VTYVCLDVCDYLSLAIKYVQNEFITLFTAVGLTLTFSHIFNLVVLLHAYLFTFQRVYFDGKFR